MKKVYKHNTDILSYIEYTDKELVEIQKTINKVEDKSLRLSLTEKLGMMMPITEIIYNQYGLGVEITKTFVYKDDNGILINDYCMDDYSTAKLIIYQYADKLFSPKAEKEQIDKLLAKGTEHLNNLLETMSVNMKGGRNEC